MRVKYLFSAATLLTISTALGCAMPDAFSFAKKPAPPAPTFAPGPATPRPASPMVAAVTENPVSRGVSSAYKKTAEMLTINPRVKEAPDPLSLEAKLPEPTAQLYVSMAEVQASSGTVEQATELYRRALELEPTHLDASLGLAHLHDREGKLDEAAQLYALAVKQHPESARTRNDLGLCLARQGKFREAATLLESAVKLDSQKKLYRNNLATVLVETGRTNEAFEHLSAAHGTAIAHYNLGYLLRQRGQDDAARGHFAQALQQNPQFVEAQAMLAELNGARGNAAGPSMAVSAPQATSPSPQIQTPQERIALRVPNAALRAGQNLPTAPTPSVTPSTAAESDNVVGSRYVLSPTTPLTAAPQEASSSNLRQPNHQFASASESAPSPEAVHFYGSDAEPTKLPAVDGRY